jgi:hypothetical protein
MEDSMSKKSLLVLLFLYVFSTGITYASLSVIKGNSAQNNQVATENDQADQADDGGTKILTIAPSEAKDQACPLNGKQYTMTEKNAWEKRRPLAVMIENLPEARPQSGLSKADIMFEALAEGGVTRFMGIYYCDVQAEDTTLAPIRSARTYFIDWASGFNLPLYVHVGGANTPGPADALGQLSDYGWVGSTGNDLNQFSIGYPTFVRDYNRVPGKDDLATEHTMVTSTEKLWAVGAKRGWTNLSPVKTVGKKTTGGTDWKDGFAAGSFQDGKATGTVATISFAFWDGFDQYAVKWDYDQATNSYKRTMAGEPHVDLNNQKQIIAKNVIVLLTDEKGPIDDKKHMLYRTTGTGDALIFQNGEAIKGKWEKKDRTAKLIFKDAKGKELQFVRGMTWISVVSIKTTVTY